MNGNNAAAIESLRTSVKMAESNNFPELIAVAKNTLGCVYTAVGDYPLALKQFNDCVTLLNTAQVDSGTAAIMHCNKGVMEQLKGGDGMQPLDGCVRLPR